jgi:hypothetical protein
MTMEQNDVYKAAAGLDSRNKKRDFVLLDSLDNFQPLNNQVLIKINPDEYEQLTSGIILSDESFLDEANRYNPAMHAVRHGFIAKQPKEFIYSPSGTESHRTTIETKVGDIVYFPIVESVNCPLLRCNEEWYLMMGYECLYLAKREINTPPEDCDILIQGAVDNYYNVIMLNGYLLTEQQYDIDDNPLRIDDGKILNNKKCKVIFSGTPVEYREHPAKSIHSTKMNCKGYSDGKIAYSNKEINNGDMVMPSRVIQDAVVLLEDSLHLHFDGKNNYRLLQRKYIDAIL